MFIGHFAMGLGARRNNDLPSLAILFIAVQLLDLLWPIFVLAGWESFQIEPGNTVLTPLNFTHYPYSHSLLMSVVWALAFALLYFIFTKNKKGSLLIGALVISHWILDFITHRPDLQISPFSEYRVGLGLWNHPVTEIAVELGLFLISAVLYFVTIKPKRIYSYWILIAFFLVIHFLNMLGPAPPSINAVAWSANLMWIFVLWALWIEKK